MKKQYPLLIAAFVLGFDIGKGKVLLTTSKWARNRRLAIFGYTFDKAHLFLEDVNHLKGNVDVDEGMADYNGYLMHNMY